jgi:hypothetical protein
LLWQERIYKPGDCFYDGRGGGGGGGGVAAAAAADDDDDYAEKTTSYFRTVGLQVVNRIRDPNSKRNTNHPPCNYIKRRWGG